MATRSKLTTLAYIAGIVDGEGHVGISRSLPKRRRYHCEKTPRFEISLDVVNTSKELIDFLSQYKKGSVQKRKMYDEKHTQSWSWRLKAKKALEVLNEIRPYLLIKCEQADLVKKFEKMKRKYIRNQKSWLDDKEYKRREKIWLKMKFLNRRNRGSDRSRND